MDPFLAAAALAVEEAVVNALINNRDVHGRAGHWTPALPHDLLVNRLRSAGVIALPQ
jgi:L-aminopeptidase/D-esterase-like protein